MQKQQLIIVGVVVLLVVAGVYYYFTQYKTSPAEEEPTVLEQVKEEAGLGAGLFDQVETSTPTDQLPDTNPFDVETVNPFGDAETNPFKKDVFQNLFGN